MFNQQMLGGMGQLPDLPTQAELWKEEKTKYRPFIVLFGIGILAVFALLLASFIVNVSASGMKANISSRLLEMFASDYSKFADPKGQADADASGWYQSYILIYPIVSFCLLGIGVVLYGASLYDSYKNKTFAKLSSYATFIVLIGAAFSAYQLLQMAWSDYAKLEIQFAGGIFQIVAYALVIALAFLGSQVTRIKRIFFASARIEALKNDPAFKAAQDQLTQIMSGQMPQNQTMGPFGPVVGATDAQTDGAAVETAANPATTPVSKEVAKLEAMSIADLKKVAKKLSISGADKMDKKELIEAIIRVTDNK